MKSKKTAQSNYIDDDHFGQFCLIDEIEDNHEYITQSIRKHKLSDPFIDELSYINNNYPSSNNELPSNNKLPSIINRVVLCIGISCIGIVSCCAVFIYSIQFW